MNARQQIQISQWTYVAISIGEHISIERGLQQYIVRLSFPWELRGRIQNAEHHSVTIFHGDISAHGKGQWLEVGRAVVVDNFDRSRLGGRNETSDSFTLGLSLTPSEYNALDALRDGGKLHLRVRLAYECQVLVTATNSVGTPMFLAEPPRRLSDQTLERKFDQSGWLEASQRAGTMARFLIETPANYGNDPVVKDVVSFYEKAYAAASSGLYTDCVTHGRAMLERLGEVLSDKEAVSGAWRKAKDERPDEWSKDERLQLLRRCLYTYAAAGPHADDVALSHRWDQHDASAFLMMLGAVLRSVFKPLPQ